MAPTNRQAKFLRLLACIDQQIVECKSQLAEPVRDDDFLPLLVEELASLQATRRYIERRLANDSATIN
jgi:hypothetical protein